MDKPRCTCTPQYYDGKPFHRGDCRAEIWNGAIAAAAEVVETGFERGEYSRLETVEAIRKLIVPDEPAPIRQTM